MTLRRAQVYVSLLAVLGGSVAANVLLLQPRPAQRGLTVAQIQSAGGEVRIDVAHRPSPASRGAASAGSWREASAQTTRAIQRELKQAGYYSGPADGVANLSTHAAIMAYESDHGLTLTGAPADELLRMLILGAAEAEERPGSESSVVKGSPAEQVTRLVQQQLAGRGYNIGAIDGRLGEDTRRAILAFEAEQNISPSGRVSAALVAKLQAPATGRRVVAGR
jgi:peptidoglycan hydrolase-like protein with peptidoglycan-binding domain